jgi:ubiquinone/menaquinone biosynthesis C-methylase UbiE
MERIKQENLNTPEEFDKLWHGDMAANRRQFDLYRYRALMEGIRGKVIELGCGCSEFLSFASNHHPEIKATGLDFSKFAIEYMGQIDPRIRWILGNALATGLESDSFDHVVSGELIEHLEEPSKLVAEMKRICKPGGIVRISTLLPHLQATDRYHIWKFWESDLAQLFSVVGVTTIKTVGNYFIVSAVKK